MSVQNDPRNTLEELRRLINTSIDIVQEDLTRHNDPPLDLASTKRHPLRDRYDPNVARAIKSITGASVMLKALCDPDAWVHDLLFHFHDLSALHVACQADVANILEEQPRSADEIAAVTGLDAEKVSRYLRALCNIHIFREMAPDVYANNELSLNFQSVSKRSLVGFCAEESRLSSCKAWESLTLSEFKSSNATNKSPFNIAYQTDLNMFEYWQNVRPDLGERGAKGFAGLGLNYDRFFALYPWAEEPQDTLVVDVGGGVGGATIPILKRFLNLRLQVQDLPENEKHFHEALEHDHPSLVVDSGRAAFMVHDFFTPQPTKNAGIYFMRHVIHNWLDPEATKLLSNIATAMSPSSKVLIMEHIVLPVYRSSEGQAKIEDESLMAPEPLLPNWGASFTSRLDLQVLGCLNARQRSVADFSRLADAAGLKVRRIWRNFGDEAIVECRLK